MAVNGINTTETGVGSIPEFKDDNTYTSSTPLTGSDLVIGFDTRNIGFMSMQAGSEYTNKVGTAIQELLQNNKHEGKVKIKPEVTVLDNSLYTNLDYSVIVVSALLGKAICYYSVILEATGRSSFTAKEITDELEAAKRNPVQQNRYVDVYVPGDCNDVNLHSQIEEVLFGKYHGAEEVISLDGHVFFKDLEVSRDSITRTTVLAYNAIYAQAVIENGFKDLNISYAMTPSNNNDGTSKTGQPLIRSMRALANTSVPTSTSEVGTPVRSNWQLALEAQCSTRSGRQSERNNRGVSLMLSRSTGFIEAIPQEADVQAYPGGPVMKKKQFVPNIVITSVAPQAPMTGYLLLSIISSIIMTDSNMWLAALDVKNAGALNLFTDLTNAVGTGKSPVGEKMDFTKQGFEKYYPLLKEMFGTQPLVSVDAESFGPQTFYTSILTAAAAPAVSKETADMKRAASEMLIDAAVWLTNGLFPKDFNPDSIFVSEGIVIPTGTWSDKSGLRDIRDIDYAFIANQTDDLNILQKWAMTVLPFSKNGGLDPFLTRVEIINKFIPTAKITGKATRVTFTSLFINTLVDAAKRSGLNITYEPEIKTVDNSVNFSQFNGYLQAGLLNNAYGFANEFTQGGWSFNTPYAYTNGGKY